MHRGYGHALNLHKIRSAVLRCGVTDGSLYTQRTIAAHKGRAYSSRMSYLPFLESLASIGVGVGFIAATVFVLYKLNQTVADSRVLAQRWKPSPTNAELEDDEREGGREQERGLDGGSRSRRQSRINAELQIDEEDLALNRAGLTSERQRAYISRSDIGVWLVSGLVFFVLCFSIVNICLDAAEQSTPFLEIAMPILFYAVLLVAVCGFVYLSYVQSPLRFKGGVVRTAEGPVKLVRAFAPVIGKRRYDRRYAFQVISGGVAMDVSEALFRLLDERRRYHVYYLEGGQNALVGIEELG